MSSKGHSRNPGYTPGEHWATCDRCGFEFHVSKLRLTWDNLLVCSSDWETRHPQELGLSGGAAMGVGQAKSGHSGFSNDDNDFDPPKDF